MAHQPTEREQRLELVLRELVEAIRDSEALQAGFTSGSKEATSQRLLRAYVAGLKMLDTLKGHPQPAAPSR